MGLLVYFSNCMVPFLVILIVTYGLLEGVKVYDEFILGAKKGFYTVVKIMPTLIGLMVAVGILRTSGFFDFFAQILGSVTDHWGFPSQLMPLAVVRMFSSSAATSLVLDLFKEYGTDSRIGLIASIMMSCTESVFYTMSVYFMAVKVRKSRYTLPGAILATLAGIIASVWLVKFL